MVFRCDNIIAILTLYLEANSHDVCNLEMLEQKLHLPTYLPTYLYRDKVRVAK